MTKKVLITGGLGFIGFYLADLFLKSDFLVRILDVGPRPHDLSPDFEYIEGDVAAKESWRMALDGVTHILHLAAYGDHNPVLHQYFTVNAVGIALLYDVIVEEKLPIQQVIVASSQSVYGEGKYRCREHGIWYPVSRKKEDLAAGRFDIYCPEDNTLAEVLSSHEDDRLLPVSPYGISKVALDQFAITVGREFGIPSVALRYAMVSGAYPSMRKLYPGAVKFYTERAVSDEPTPIQEDGNQLRDFVHIKDLGKAHLVVLDNPKAFFQSYNVGSGTSVKIVDLARAVYEEFDTPFQPIFTGEVRRFTPRHWMMSNKKMQSLGWKPKSTFREGVREYIEAAKRLT